MFKNIKFDTLSIVLLLLGNIIFISSCFYYNKTRTAASYLNLNIFNSKIKDIGYLERFLNFLVTIGITIGLTWILFGLMGFEV